MWTDKRKLSAADCDEGPRPPIKTSAKLMVCQAKDGSIRTRKIASTDHDYLQKETESTSVVINDPIAPDIQVPPGIAEAMSVDMISNGINLSRVVCGEISIRTLVVKCVDGVYEIQPPPGTGLIDLAHVGTDEQLIFMARDLCNLFDSKASKSMTQHMNKSITNYTQVSFKEVKVKGVNNPKSLSFLSITGLFSILFTCTNIARQRLIAASLWDLWLRDCEKPLPPKLDFSLPNAIRILYKRKQSAQPSSMIRPLDKLLECIDMVTTGCGVVQPCYTHNLRDLLNSYRSLCVKCGEEDFNRVVKKHEELVQSLISYEKPTDNPSPDQSAGNSSAEAAAEISADTAASVRLEVKSSADSSLDTQDRCDISAAMLEVTSDWLGREFHSMHNFVQDSVAKYKTENIHSIGTLPSAQRTCSIFPRAMVVLFERWLASPSVADEPMTDSKSFSDTRDIYPFIQLLLEFANNSLISGVAHVVYTQILKDPT